MVYQTETCTDAHLASNCNGNSNVQVAFQLTAVIAVLTLDTTSLESDHAPQSDAESVLCVKVSFEEV